MTEKKIHPKYHTLNPSLCPRLTFKRFPQEHLYLNTLKELERLQRSHDTLAERIGAPETTDVADPGRSLHAEMESEPEEEGWLRSEAAQVYKQLRALALQLNTGHDDDSGEFIFKYGRKIQYIKYSLERKYDLLWHPHKYTKILPN